MTERIKNIGLQLLDMWKKYSAKQKTLIISVVCVVIIAFALLIFLMNRVDYTQLKVSDNAKEASEITELLKANNIKYKFNTGTLAISVDSKKYEDAFLLLNENDISTDDVSIDDLLGNSLSTTNSDRILKINLYFQNKLKNKIKQMEGIDDAEVYYIPKEDSSSIFTDEVSDTSASVMLTVNNDFNPESAETIAEAVAAVIGNKSTDNIRVSDQYGNLLFGGTQDLYSGVASDIADYKQRLRNTFINNLYLSLIKSGYDDVEIAPNLKFNMNKVEEMYKEYTAPEGMDQGLYSHSYTYETNNTNSSGGVPGTSSNDGTTYETQNPANSNSSSESQEYDYLPNERITNTEYEIGAVIPEESTISIVAIDLITYTQKELKDSGALDGTTFDQYVKEHSDLVPIEVDASILNLVSTATGIPLTGITINAYQKPVFVPTTSKSFNVTNLMQIALAVLIVGLLAFVVFKGVKPVEVTELEPELSVEQLLATTKENQTIEDIEFNEVSEVHKMIEKFVDEKPEAVAQLLRNWLNEDWG